MVVEESITDDWKGSKYASCSTFCGAWFVGGPTMLLVLCRPLLGGYRMRREQLVSRKRERLPRARLSLAPMGVARKQDGWWVVRIPDCCDCGPYKTKQDAEDTRRGLQRTFDNIDDRTFLLAKNHNAAAGYRSREWNRIPGSYPYGSAASCGVVSKR
jgi:hypothetical protein